MKKLALITGATSGIGLGIAKKFASLGINIAFVGRSPSQTNIDDIQRLFHDHYKVDSFYEDVDVSKRFQVDSFVEKVFS